MPATPTLLAVPNVSEGRARASVAKLAAAFDTSPARLLDVHSDADHHRSVLTLAGPPGSLAGAVLHGAAETLRLVDVMLGAHSGAGRPDPSGAPRARDGDASPGQHPHVGALDVAPIVYLDPRDRGAACAEALLLADRLGSELQIPVFLYGELSADEERPARTRAELRRGGVGALAARMDAESAGERTDPTALRPDFGPPRLHPTAGATLVAAREPLVAFNLQLAAPATLDDARAIASRIREGGEHGLPGLRAIGVLLEGGVAQVSMNVERPLELSLAEVVQAVRSHTAVVSAELVGLAPRAAFDGFPADLPIPGFDPARRMIENAIG